MRPPAPYLRATDRQRPRCMPAILRAAVRAGVLVWCLLPAVSGFGQSTDGAVTLDDIVVTSTRSAQRPRDVPGSMTVLSQPDIEAMQAVTVDALFNSVPGVDLSGSGFPGSEVKLGVRGLTTGYQSKRVLTRIDGRRVNDPYQGNVEFATLPADYLEQVELLKGPISSLYGSNAMGGVLNIRTRRGRPTPYTQASATVGPWRTRLCRAGHGWQTGRFDYFLSGSSVRTDGYLDNRDGSDREFSAENIAANFGLAVTPEDELRLGLGQYTASGTDDNSRRHTDRDYQNLSYETGIGGGAGGRLRLQLYRTRERTGYGWTYAPTGLYNLTNLGGEAQYTLAIGEAHRLVFGVDALEDDAQIDEATGRIDETSRTIGVYLQDEWSLTEHWQIHAGLRRDDNSDYDAQWSPRIGGLFRAGTDTELFGSYGQAHRAPALSDRFVRTTYNGFLFVGNPDLQPETLHAYEIGMRHRWPELASIECTLFHSQMEESFDFVLDPDGVFRIRNITETRLTGIEMGGDAKISKRVRAFANYTYTDGRYTRFPQQPSVEGNRLAYLAMHKAALGVEFRSERFGTHRLQCRYVGERHADAQSTAAKRLDDYLLADWRSRLPLAPHLDLTVRIDNLFDVRYQDFPDTPQPGVGLYLGAELSF